MSERDLEIFISDFCLNTVLYYIILYYIILAEGRPSVDFCSRLARPNRKTVKKDLNLPISKGRITTDTVHSCTYLDVYKFSFMNIY